MDRSAPLNIDPVSIAATFHPSQNVTANPTSLHQMDMLDEDFLRPTTIRFAETDTGNNFSNFQHNSIQRPSPQLPLNPLFGSNPQNTLSQHPSHEPCDSHGPSAVRFNVLYLPIILRFQQQQLRSGLYLLQALKQVISSVNVLLSNYQTSNLTALMVIPCFGPTGSLCSSLPPTITSD